jgi:hypothetical protein
MAAVLQDNQLSHTARGVLVHGGVCAILAGDDTLDVDVDRIAAEMHLGADAVTEALHRGRELGWLELDCQRWRARPRRR